MSPRPAFARDTLIGPRPKSQPAFVRCCVTQRPSLVGRFIAPLHRAGVEYMVTGGLAVNQHALDRWITHFRLDAEWDRARRFAEEP